MSSGFNFSPWCALFTEDDLKVFEYECDLRHFYRNGYGTELNKKFGAPPLEDLLLTFRQVLEGGQRKLTGYFSHATMMDMIYSALGLFKDRKPLTGDKLVKGRKWRSSFHSAFSANLVAVLNRWVKIYLTQLLMVTVFVIFVLGKYHHGYIKKGKPVPRITNYDTSATLSIKLWSEN